MLINLLEEEISMHKATPGGPPPNLLVNNDANGPTSSPSQSRAKGTTDGIVSLWSAEQGKRARSNLKTQSTFEN